MKLRVQKTDQGFALHIPPEIAAQWQLTDESELEAARQGERLVIGPPDVPQYRLEELVAGITDENRHEETDTGPAMGNEVW
jgi:antitoxin MazE